MKFIKITCALFLILFAINISAQELPPIKIFSPEQYHAGNQNWSICQSKENYIYVANNKGLLEYNGAEWKLYPTPNETIMRSVKVIGDKIFTGFYMDFGYWLKNEKGILEYNSIAKENKIPLLEDEQFWNIVEYNDWVLFQSLNRIYLYNIKNNTYKVIQSDSIITKIINVNNTIYFQKFNEGIYKIENGEAELVTNYLSLINSKLVGIYEIDNDLLFLTQHNGFYKLDGNKIEQWKIPANKFLLERTIYSCIQLRNKDFVIGTISDGIIYLKNTGELDYYINQENGLSNNAVLSLYEDDQNTIWLGLDNGINSIDATSSFKIYNDTDGLFGTIYCSIIKGGVIYLGTNHGLFFKEINSKDKFKFIENTEGQVWSLVEIDGNLYCGHDNGTYRIERDKALKLINIEGTWDIKEIKDNLYIQGNYDGLYILEKSAGNLVLRNKILGFENSSKHFEILGENTIFVNHEYKGVYKLTLDNDYKKVLKVESIKLTDKSIYSSLVKYNEDLLYSYKKGVFKYDLPTNTFIKDSIYSLLFNEENYTSGKLVYDKERNKLWGFSSENISFLEPDKLSKKLTLTKIPILETYRKGVSGYENIKLINDQNYIIGTSNGYLTIDLKNNKEEEEYIVNISSISVNRIDSEPFKVNKNEYGEFLNKENNIEFKLNVPFYQSLIEPNYQHQLVGHENNWSDWSIESKVLFKNLPYGEYTFNARARIGNTIISNEAIYSFEISKPWYLSTLMLFIYILSFILFYLFMHAIYRRYYKKQQKNVIEKKQREYELMSLESEKQFMQLKNEKLRSDIENKSKELATATMTAIKKNEFLNSIKKELQNSNEKNVQKVVKIIDKDLNNTDDWKLFKEAFNNADKDFIKKLKTLHPNLTPNDLRLCAYLRLNLSSKEISPLLNISPRSVEVKRYRLRKKINLAHDMNLTNYILEI